MNEKIDKQAVEEMAKAIFEPKVAIDGIDIAFASVHGADKAESHFMRIAEHLYNAGYRRQSEGEWRLLRNMMCECSMCHDCFNYYSSTDLPNFCPNCGAKMKGGGE